MNCHLAITRVKFVYLIDACVLRRIINEEGVTNVKSISINYKQYSCPVPTINVPDEICNETLLKHSSYEEIDWMEVVISTDQTSQ